MSYDDEEDVEGEMLDLIYQEMVIEKFLDEIAKEQK